MQPRVVNHPLCDPVLSDDGVVLIARLLKAGTSTTTEVPDLVALVGARYFSFKEVGKM